ncbi:MAG: hypothetical protein GQ540_03815 [Lutibacter sp.]|uniref:hypothetical protein n=1 Tax=Lutibacter sp. TaxID=1925666 RepID=UPI0019E864EF|nr:hypothetical protein [Lutibacter sp.]NOR27640.1 hypothetical protein [Lutibacter sp.]
MSVTAKIKVILKIDVCGKWSDDCTVAQVKKQVKDSADCILNQALKNKPENIIIWKESEIVEIIYSEDK